MSFSRETVVCVLLFCIGINFFSATSYLIGHYTALGSDGLIFDLLLGFETVVNLVSDFMLLSALQASSNPAFQGPPHAVVVQTIRNFLILNTGTVLFCFVTHISASYYLAQHNGVFYQLALYYVFLVLVKGLILYNIFGFYKEFKDNPPSVDVLLVIVNKNTQQGACPC
ncbi:hypothetical protein MTO96_009235 [Rhipicephalus appendiculatus]